MNSLHRRVDKIEGRLEPGRGPGIRWHKPDGTFIEVPCGLTLNHPQIALAVARGGRRADEARRQSQSD